MRRAFPLARRHPVSLWGGGFTTIVVCFAWAQSAQAASVLSGPEVNPSNGHSYYLLTSDFWEPSQDAAVALGGHLVTVNNQAENDWVFDTFALFGGESRTLWTGYHRLAPAGQFVWVSGEPIGFENWFPGEPNNSTGAENYAAFVPTAQHPGKQWFDMFDSTGYFGTPINGVVEVVPVLAGDYNGNGSVDAADYTVWRDTLGQSVMQGIGADGDGSGVVDTADYDTRGRRTSGQRTLARWGLHRPLPCRSRHRWRCWSRAWSSCSGAGTTSDDQINLFRRYIERP